MVMGTAPKWVDADGINTRYFEAGEGEPLLLVTGGNFGSGDAASIVETWDRNFLSLSKHYRVIAVDKLGQGHTDNPLHDDDYTMDAVVRHLGSFIKVLKLEGIHMVGQSRGAMAAVCVTLDYSEHVRSCTLVNTSTLAPGVGLNEVYLGGSPYPKLSRETQRWVFERCDVDKSVVDECFLDEGEKVFQLPKYIESVRKMDVEGLKTTRFIPELARLKRDTLRRIAEEGIGRPTQLIWGANDHTAPIERAIDLFHIVSRRERQTTMHIFAEAGHHPYREYPTQFNELMLGFTKSMQP
ncbi:alpha/beta fold hydrolase [Bordetella petrii]|nr:alpha/beta fold hydrolase [Bordetella petrii]